MPDFAPQVHPLQVARAPSPEGEALVRAYAQTVATGSPGPVSLGAGVPSWARESFDRALVAAIRDSEECLRRWTRALEDAVQRCLGVLAQWLEDQPAAAPFRGAVAAWTDACNPRELLSGGIHGEWETALDVADILGVMHIFVRLDLGAALCALERSPHPGFIDVVLWLTFEHDDLAVMADVLRAAPTVFDEQGAWLGRNVVALVALHQIPQRLENRAESPGRQGNVDAENDSACGAGLGVDRWRTDVLPGTLRELVAGVLAREDGPELAAAMCASMADRAIGTEPGAGAARPSTEEEPLWSVFAHAWEVLAGELACARRAHVVNDLQCALLRAEGTASKRRPTARRAMGRAPSVSAWEGEGARRFHARGLPFLLSAAQAATPANGRPDPELLGTLWAWLIELILGRDPALGCIAIQDGASMAFARLGTLLALLPVPLESLQVAYRRLEPQRRRRRYPLRYDDLDGDAESRFLLRVGLAALEAAPDEPMPAGKAGTSEQMFEWIFERARQLWLTTPFGPNEAADGLVAACFAYAPRALGSALLSKLPALLIAVSPALNVHATACLLLLRNGVSLADVEAGCEVAGVDLRRSVSELGRWFESGFLEERHCPAAGPLAAVLGLEVPALALHHRAASRS